ncbi:natural resistance-associated macrophage protein-domain-containing protein [Absidia repens]|uniref:Natural resistance-associated macrophage protein-domain-containing protein n=1 Tax=Absidia repens TaxID=90262 RepID=A0A1X2HXG6_9FUNG|nr:natural resistance-associated macrophage protein-domain-containing protein [Absidia repens]
MARHILGRIALYLRRLALFIGPGFMVAVGYLDPGNWATNIEAGSQFGYRLLFIILISNIIALFLQNLTIRLGTVTGLDLAAACRHYLPRYVSLFLYVLAEGAIIATDLAEVIGSAIALNMLFPTLPLPAGVAITAADVLIILLCYKEPDPNPDNLSDGQDDSTRMVRYFEMFVMLLVAAVGICFIIEMAYSDIVAVDVLKGYLPSKEIFTDTEALYISIGIIGATVMPHNLFLHSYIIQARCYSWRHARPRVTSSSSTDEVNNNSNDDSDSNQNATQQHTIQYKHRLLDALDDHQRLYSATKNKDDDNNNDHSKHQSWVSDKPKSSIDGLPAAATTGHDLTEMDHISTATTTSLQQQQQQQPEQDRLDLSLLRAHLTDNMHINLHYGFMDLMVALLFAFFVNSAILIVASANFHFKQHLHAVSDLFDAHALLQQYLGPAAAVIFALALLFAGQSSTLTATLAGQVVMSGFLGMTSRPWLRRIVTRLVAIVPAMIAACVAGRAGLSQMLVASQVALSIQLPFAVVPLVLFTSLPRIMHLDVVALAPRQLLPALPRFLDRWCAQAALGLDRVLLAGQRALPAFMNNNNNKKKKKQQQQQSDDDALEIDMVKDANKNPSTQLSTLPDPIYYVNGKCTIVVAIVISLLLIGLNGYLVVSSILGY